MTLAEAILDASVYDESFCAPASSRRCVALRCQSGDACNARLKPPPPHVGRLLGAAARHQAVADFYAFGFNHPDRYWEVVSSEDRTTHCCNR